MKNIFITLFFLLCFGLQGVSQTVTVSASTVSACYFEPITFDYTQSGLTEPLTCFWNFDNGSYSNQCSPTKFFISGIYNACLMITDANGLEVEDCIEVTVNPSISLDFQSTDPTNCSSNDGTIEVLPIGGTAPYTYLWSNSETSDVITNLNLGSYTVTVTDVNGCTKEGYKYLTSVPLIVVTDSEGNIDDDGWICAYAPPPATLSIYDPAAVAYSWSNGETTATISAFTSNTYSVTITDSNGCEAAREVDVVFGNPNYEIAIVDNFSDTICNGESIILDAGGGYLSYGWAMGYTTQAITVGGGNYAVTVMDSGGCFYVDSLEIVERPALDTQNIIITDATCGLADGGIDLPSSYICQWSDGSTLCSRNGLVSGTYVATITDPANPTCPSMIDVEVPSVNDLTLTITNIINPTCQEANGSATALVGGGSGNYDYIWNTAATTITHTNLSAGTYTVTVTDNSTGCEVEETLILGGVPITDYTITIVDSPSINCMGVNDGTVSYTISPASGSPSITDTNGSIVSNGNLGLGTYCITVIDGNGCIGGIECFDVIEPTPIDAEIETTSSSPICEGEGFSMQCVINNPSNPIISYEWSGLGLLNSTGQTITTSGGLIPGTYTYTVTVTNSNNCTATAEKIVVINEIPTISIISPSSVCEFENFSLQCVGGSSSNDTYEWEGGGLFATGGQSTVASGFDVGSHDYTVTITDSNGCTASAETTVVVNPQPTLQIPPVDPICMGGSASLTAIGPAGSTYEWSGDIMATTPGQTIVDGPFTFPGDYGYDVTVTDPNGCTFSEQTVVTVNEAPIIEIVGPSTVCDVEPFSLECVVNNPSNPILSYAWSDDGYLTSALNAQTVSTTGLPFGLDYTFTVTVTDFSGCTTSAETTVTILDIPGVENVLITDATCGLSNGEAEVVVTQTHPPYSYEWSNGYTGLVATGLDPGFYTVIITDANGCTMEEGATISNIDAPVVSIDYIVPATCGLADGEAVLSPNNYTYTWNDGWLGASHTGMTSGSYFVTVTDPANSGCPNVIEIIVPEDNPLTVTITDIVNPTCGTADGAATVVATNGSGNYTYLWSTGNTTTTDTGLPAGTYQVTVTDLTTGCETEEFFILTDALITNYTIIIVNNPSVSCSDATDGTVDFTISPVPTGSVSILDAQGSLVVNGTLEPGSYCILVEDENGCIGGQECFDVMEVPPIGMDIELINISSCGLTDGYIDFTTTGGTTPYTYTWSNGSTLEDLVNIEAGIYSVTITDANNCISIAEGLEILDSNMLETPEESTITRCPGEAATLTAGINGATYLWSNLAITQSINTDVVGVYSVTITDSNNCTGIQSFIVEAADDCVWPGDANYDGLANNQDVLFLGMAYGNTGQNRMNPSINWEGQLAPFEWDSLFNNGTNQKHADSDGNGIVEQDDTMAIVENYNLPAHALKETNEDGDNILHVNFNSSSSDYDQYVELEVNLADIEQAVPEAYGLAFSIVFNYPQVINPESIQVDFGNSIFGSPSETISLFKFLGEEGRMDFAVTRFDHVGLTDLQGGVVSVKFIIEDNIDGFAPTDNYILDASVTDIYCVKTWGEEVILTPTSSELTMLPSNSIADLEKEEAALDYYPNPTQEVLYLNMKGNSTIKQVRIFDTLGRLIEEEKASDIEEVKTNEWEAGMYFFEVTDSEDRQYLLRIIKE